jgi:hypothetical protein
VIGLAMRQIIASLARLAALARPAMVAGAFWIIGLLLAFHPTLLTEFSRMQGAPVDTRLNNYILESEYLWATSAGQRSLWNPGIFFPVSDVAAFGDVELGALPYYGAWRLLGIPHDTAFQLWCMTILSLDFAVFWLFLRNIIGASAIAASYGAFLFAFGAPRVNQVGHEQLFSQFYAVAALYALYRACNGAAQPAHAWRSTAWLALFLAAIVAQLYTAFYLSWFFLLALFVCAMWATLLPSCRAVMLPIIRRGWPALLAGGALAVLATRPLYTHYVEAARMVGMREWRNVEPMLPRPQSWIYLGPFSRLYRWQYGLALFHSLDHDQEHRLGLGILTTVLACIGLWRGWEHRGTRLVVLVAATLLLCATSVPLGEWGWRAVFDAVPGASAIRAVARIGILMLIPFGVGLAYCVDALPPRRMILALVLIGSMLEQAQTTPSYDKLAVRGDVAALAAKIGATCHAFLFTPLAGSGSGQSGFEHGKHQLDAMWAGLLTNTPTINGLSGNSPPGWDFFETTVRDAADEQRIERALGAWCSRWHLDAQRVCWIRTGVDWTWSAPQEPLLRDALRRWREH